MASVLSEDIIEAAISSNFVTPSEDYLTFVYLLNTINAVIGIIGSGKTTFLNVAREYLDKIGLPTRILFEEPNRELLTLFYRDMKKYAFSFQMDMLRQRQRCNEISSDSRNSGSIIWNDRAMIDDPVFFLLHLEKGNINLDEAKAYLSVLKSMGPYSYDHVVFLDVESDQALYRIHHLRKNPAESGLTLDYMQELRRAYYRQIRRLALAGKSRIVYIYNEPYCEIRVALQRIRDSPSPDTTTHIFSLAPNLSEKATEEEVSDAFGIVRKAYDAYYMKRSVSIAEYLVTAA